LDTLPQGIIVVGRPRATIDRFQSAFGVVLVSMRAHSRAVLCQIPGRVVGDGLEAKRSYVVGIIRVEGQSRATAPSGWAVHVPPAVVAEREVVSGGPRRPRTRQPVQRVIRGSRSQISFADLQHDKINSGRF
jgi:hypothetical protein